MSAVASIMSLAVVKDVTNNALTYFVIADVFILLCIVSYLLLPKLAYSRSVTTKTSFLHFRYCFKSTAIVKYIFCFLSDTTC